MTFSSQHHSFDIKLAAIYGIEEAIIIHHFQHWVRVNLKKKTNFRDGKTWTYQTRKEILIQFPYFTFDTVRRACEKLIEMGVLVAKNYNKSKVDKTLWYAFADEEAFGVDPQNSNNIYERQNCLSKGKIASPEGKIATPIPDILKEDPKTEDIREEGRGSAPPSADAESLSDFFLSKIRERSPKFKEPNRVKWAKEIDLMIRLEKREPQEIRRVIEWISTDQFWKGVCLSPSKLRDKYDQLVMQMQGNDERGLVRKNRNYALWLKDKYPDHMKGLTFDDKFAMNRSVGKEIPFNLPEKTFQDALISMFEDKRR